jgi:glycosyltransferase involved in cell wall biosynthesis
MRVCICSTKIPFAYGGAEILDETLELELSRRGFDVDRVSLPFNYSSRAELLKSGLVWRLLDLKTATGEDIDLVIATRFPSYLIRHRNKVVWLYHQFRQAYDLDGTRYGFLDQGAEGRSVVETIHAMDRRGLGEARGLFTIARNVAKRLEAHNDLEAETLYPPPKLADQLRCEGYGDYVFFAGRLDDMKRVEAMVRAFEHTRSGVQGKIAGTGPLMEALQSRISEANLSGKVELLGWIEDEELLEHYARCLAVYHAPYDEDYGFVTLEAFGALKAVVTAADSGGVLEFVRDGVNGRICDAAEPRQIARAFDEMFEDRSRAQAMGEKGREAIAGVSWDRVIDELTASLPT